jgi:hypothetical protein
VVLSSRRQRTPPALFVIRRKFAIPGIRFF